MTRGGWQVRERKARQAAKASRISGPLSISPPPTKAITKSATGCPDIDPFPSNKSATDSVPLALSADSPPRPLDFSDSSDWVAPAAAATTIPARPSTPVPPLAPNSLNGTLIDGSSPPAIAAATTASSTSSTPVNSAASIQLKLITATLFDAIIHKLSDPSFLQDLGHGEMLNKRAKRKVAEAATAAVATLEPSPIGELSEELGDAGLAQFNSNQSPTFEELEQTAATAEQLGAEMRQLLLVFPETKGYDGDEKGEGPEQQQQQQQVEDLESITAKITAFRQALQNDVKVPVQNYGGLQSRQNQQEKELQEAIIQAKMRIADFQSRAAQAHEDLFSFMTHKLAKKEEASKNSSHAAARIIALLIFCNCVFLSLLIAPYL